jgi:hypothetical protein
MLDAHATRAKDAEPARTLDAGQAAAWRLHFSKPERRKMLPRFAGGLDTFCYKSCCHLQLLV